MQFSSMRLSTPAVLAIGLSLSNLVNAHMKLGNPKPFPSQNNDNAPLLADGSNYPCKGDTSYDANGVSNVWPLGSTQELATIGQAVHGGGSCQISITYDAKPNKNSVFKVIHSIEGGCPARGTSGNAGDNANAAAPDTYKFTVPNGLPTGSAIVAWTWFNKVGNPEMYMNCAPVTITSGSSKRDDSEGFITRRDAAFLNSLPNMFKANINNGCQTQQQGSCVKFPNPGTSLETNTCSFDPKLMFVSTDGCAAANPSSGSSSPAGSSGSASSAAPAIASPKPGVFASGAATATQPAATTAPAAPAVPVATQAPAPIASASPAPASGSSGNSANSGSTSGAGSVSGSTCSTADFGKSLCSPDGTKIGMCDYGGKIVMMPVASGTKCVGGLQVAARRFARGHIARGGLPF